MADQLHGNYIWPQADTSISAGGHFFKNKTIFDRQLLEEATAPPPHHTTPIVKMSMDKLQSYFPHENISGKMLKFCSVFNKHSNQFNKAGASIHSENKKLVKTSDVL